MKISLGVGLVTAIIGILTGFILNDWSITSKICGYIGMGCLILVGLFNGAYIGGDRTRGNYATETQETRKEKAQITKYLLIISVPNIIVALLITVAT